MIEPLQVYMYLYFQVYMYLPFPLFCPFLGEESHAFFFIPSTPFYLQILFHELNIIQRIWMLNSKKPKVQLKF